MISNDMLKKSAELADKVLLDSLPDPKDCHHEFSPEFEKKIEKLSRRAKHPVVRKVVKRAVAIAALLIVIGSLTLFISPEARATFWGWLKSGYKHFVLVSNTGTDSSINDSENISYELTWIPEGYKKLTEAGSRKNASVAYEDSEKNLLKFEYFLNPTHTKMYYFDFKGKSIKTTINEETADIYITPEGNGIVWKDSKNTLFGISGPLNEEELIRAAKSVKEITK